MSLSKRSVTSVSWNVVVSLVNVVVLLVRTVMLARLLPVKVFGIYTFAGSIVVLSSVLATFGMGGAFLHRSQETMDEEQAAANHFTLKLVFTLVWAALLVIGAFLFTDSETRMALLVLTGVNTGLELTQTPRLILTRRVMHRRLALIQLLSGVSTTILALALAWQGITLWALLATDLVTLMITIWAMYLWRPVWRPRLAWSSPTVRYFLRFGSRNFLAGTLMYALDHVDDLWTGIYLGKDPLGYYSRAYTFATYPRRILATPINQVASGTYAELKEDRRRLSQAFFRTNALLVRTGFYMAGLLSLIAPEFIRLLLGAKWLPMLEAFRLMLVYTLFDPMKIAVADLFVAVGRPEKIVWARGAQLAVMLVGLFLLGPRWGITGVALAVDIMLVVGIVILLWQARTYVDYSLWRLFSTPTLALASGLLLAFVAASLPLIRTSDWYTAPTKLIILTTIYGSILLVFERNQVSEIWNLLSSYLPRHIGRT
jgi:O-antigen/teichoic acid export membrane protein